MPSVRSVDEMLPYKKNYFAYYKGTTVCPFDDELFKTSTQCLNDHITEFLREGKHYKQLMEETKAELDALELKLVRFQLIHGCCWNKTTPEEWLGGAWGKNWKLDWICWFQLIGILLRLKAIENDDMNGWNIITV